MNIKDVNAEAILDSRKDKTIRVFIRTGNGTFSASSPNGKSKGKFETKPYKESIGRDISKIKDLQEEISDIKIEEFSDVAATASSAFKKRAVRKRKAVTKAVSKRTKKARSAVKVQVKAVRKVAKKVAPKRKKVTAKKNKNKAASKKK